MLRPTNATPNQCYAQPMLRPTNATPNQCYATNQCYAQPMLRPTNAMPNQCYALTFTPLGSAPVTFAPLGSATVTFMPLGSATTEHFVIVQSLDFYAYSLHVLVPLLDTFANQLPSRLVLADGLSIYAGVPFLARATYAAS